LKWGDPFVFDRGGQEALFLHEQGVLFEVVPGIPAAIGTPGYAGVPVTYPGGGDTVTFVRGHEDQSSVTAPEVDWSALAQLGGTVICYAGSRQQAAELVDLLESLGAEAIEAPMIRIAPPDDYGPLDEAITRAGSYDWILSTSANAADAFVRRLLAVSGDIRDLKGVKLCAVG